MTAKFNIGIRIPVDLLAKLDEVAKQTGKGRSGTALEAIALYLGEELEPTGSRVDRLEGRIESVESRVDELVLRLSSLGKLTA